MNVIVKAVTPRPAKDTQWGKSYPYAVEFENDGRTMSGIYYAKTDKQDVFQPDKEIEITAETRTYEKDGQTKSYLVIKPLSARKWNSPGGKAIQKEQSRYSGFAVSYAKDLVVAGKIPLDELKIFATELFDLMVNLDKTLVNESI